MDSLLRVCIGIDIAKLHFIACLLRAEGKPLLKEFANTPEGFAKLLRWVKHLAPGASYHFCLEATGAYSEGLAVFLAEAGLAVSVVNAYRIHHAAKAQGAANKTDMADAKVIAEFCKKENPPLWRRCAPEVQELIALLRRLQTLKDLLIAENNRLGEPNLPASVRTSLEQSSAFLSQQISALEQQISQHIDSHPRLKADRELLVSIPGIGELTAAWILAELPDVSQFTDAQAAAAYAGLAPCEYRSGTSVFKRTRLSKRGNAHLRRALYMPAMTAIRFNPVVAALYQRLVTRGLMHKAALGAAMRKLLMIAYGVLKSRRKFTAQLTAQNA